MMSTQILFASGHERRAALFIWCRVVLMVPAVIFAGTHWGIIGVAMTRPLVSVATLPLAGLLLKASIGLGLRAQLSAVWRPFTAAFIMVLAIRALHPASIDLLALRLVIDCLVGVVAYTVALSGLWLLAARPDGFEALAIKAVQDRLNRRVGRSL
ncbi:MAG: polysaccharide biosynthesis C-terminal domain-containing protein [Gammaproteobacteria bacterium]